MEPTVTVTAIGALLGLVLAIALIFKKIPPFYALLAGALIGGLIGGASLTDTVVLMTNGAKGMATSILRILSAGILAGVLIKSGAAASIAYAITKKLGAKRALLALALATMILTMVGVFIDIAVITVSAIAIEIAKTSGYSRSSVLIAMIGGGKAGNIMSPNPNAIAVSDAFGVPLTNVMLAGTVSAIFGIIVTYFIATKLSGKGSMIAEGEIVEDNSQTGLPSFGKSLVGPIVAIVILALRPLFGITVDPMIALPVGGIVEIIVLGKSKHFVEYIEYGLGKMINVAIILLGTGLIAGIITNSTLGSVLIGAIEYLGLPPFLLAPLAGILMSAATASTTSGCAVAGSVFATSLIDAGVSPIGGSAMVHAGATVLDHLPHGSFFHATGGSVNMEFKERLKLIPFESAIGLVLAAASTIVFGVIGLG
ncbi:GntP family permease [Anaerobium acetethylicum]|uniref:Gluconate:H+ symporter, GntP family n=1 Tax=Anaerobium acetethylicum TaxID=1619234 RepID=A0A1D3TPY2_9FIRM|nr:GntP family permease [Anaerobium acetethylicum]SCP95558.1 gluconate:H+ symporter, GntP family [Anaerobium acetethylicum]